MTSMPYEIKYEPPLYSLCSEKSVTDFIKKIVVGASLVSETPYELHYILPVSELKKGNFEKLFASLDENLTFLKIKSYGVKSTTLEEIFLKVTSCRKSLIQDGVGVAVTGEKQCYFLKVEFILNFLTIHKIIHLLDVVQNPTMIQPDYPLQSMEEVTDIFMPNNGDENNTILKKIFNNKSPYEKLPVEEPENTGFFISNVVHMIYREAFYLLFLKITFIYAKMIPVSRKFMGVIYG